MILTTRLYLLLTEQLLFADEHVGEVRDLLILYLTHFELAETADCARSTSLRDNVALEVLLVGKLLANEALV